MGGYTPPAIVLANNAKSRLRYPIGPLNGTIEVNEPDVFPDISGDQYFYLTLIGADDDSIEIVKVTDKVGSILTVERGVDNTTALSFRKYDPVELRLNVAAIDDYIDIEIAPASDHSVLNNLQGGTLEEYYHLTEEEYGFLNSGKFKNNLIINGDFKIWQDGTSFEGSGYTADMWRGYRLGGAATWTQDLDVPDNQGFLYSHKVDVTTAKASLDANDNAQYNYRIEGYDFATIIGKKGTLSFWVKTNKTGIYSVAFRNADASRCYIKEFTVNVPDAWERKSLIMDFDNLPGEDWLTDNGIGLIINFGLCAGTTYSGEPDTWHNENKLASVNNVNLLDSTANYFNLTGVQLIEGEEDLPFIYQNFATTMDQVHRYYYIIPVDVLGVHSADAGSTRHNFTATLPTRMRVPPIASWRTAPTYQGCSDAATPFQTSSSILHHRVDNTSTIYRAYGGTIEVDARL